MTAFFVMEHGIMRARQRIFTALECLDENPAPRILQLWHEGYKTPWHDPDDPVDHITVTSLTERGSLVGRLWVPHKHFFIVSALTVRQHTCNARYRWHRADDAYLR